MNFIADLRVCRKLAAAALGALTVLLAVAPPVWSQPPVELSPLPWALSDQARVVTSSRPVDPRAAAIGTEISEVVGDVRGRAERSAPRAGIARPTAGSARAAQSSRKPASSPAGGGRNRRAGAAIRVEPPDFAVRMRKGGSVRSLQASPSRVLQRAVAGALGDDERTARAFLRERRSLLGLRDPDNELRLRAQRSDRLGHRHLRFAQRFDGLPVYGAELIAQLDAEGNLISVNGSYGPTPRKLVTEPVVQRAQAVDLVRALHPGTSNAASAEPDLVVFLRDRVRPHLAWKLEWRVGPLETRLVLVDAHSGAVLLDINRIQSSNLPGSGVDLFGNLRNLNVWEESGVHYMMDTSKPMYDAASDPPQLGSSNGVIVVQDAANQPPTGDPPTYPPLASVTSNGADGPWLADAVSASTNLSATYDYFLAEHGRDSLDAAGSNLVAVVRLGQGLQSALFDASTQTMYFGDASPYAGALDVVAHELTHGVIAHSANLLYQNQSGALNEAFADIFAEIVEASVNGQPDWLIGSMLGEPLRDMANPGAQVSGLGVPYPSSMSDYVYTTADNGGIHVNSSIVNHAFYQLAAGFPDAIGIDAAADIFYRALTTKLTSLSDFTDARLAAIQSAEELFGVDSAEAQRTAGAFDAVQIFDTPTNPAPSPFPGSNGEDATLFVYWDGIAGDYYLGRYEPSLGDTPPGVRLSFNAVADARPSVSGAGDLAVLVDAQDDICLISTDASSTEFCLGFPGTVSSVAMSADANTFAFVLLDGTGSPDNAINVVDVDTDQTRTFDLVAPAYDGAASIEVISADALDFTSDGRYLVYDAFNELIFSDAPSVGLWSVYAIDLTTESTLAVLPPTIADDGSPLDIAYPSIAQTSDGHMTFDVLDSTAGENYVLAGNVYTGDLAIVGATSTYSTPGYTGDDSGIVYSVSDGGTPTGFSLVRQPVASDRISPSGSEASWLADADYSAVYRRGEYSGPPEVDVAVAQSITTEPGHRALVRIEVTNLGPDTATDVELTDTLPSDVDVAVTQSDGTCETLATGGQVSCALPELQASSTSVIELAAEVRSAGALTNSITAFASEPDADASDNTSFDTVDAEALNAAPAVVTSIETQTARVGSAFSFAAATHFEDADDDALSFAAAGLPAGLAIDSTTGTLSGTPATGTDRADPYDVEIAASDDFGGSAMASLELSVDPPPPPPPPQGGGGGSSSGGGGGGSVDLLMLAWLVLLAAVVGARHPGSDARGFAR